MVSLKVGDWIRERGGGGHILIKQSSSKIIEIEVLFPFFDIYEGITIFRKVQLISVFIWTLSFRMLICIQK